MNIQEYRESKLNVKPTADIAERWQKRVVTRGLDKQGRAGGEAYLESYGKRIGAKKCVKFAVQAELMGAQEFANVLWEKAHVLEGGEYESLSLEGTSETVIQIPISETLPEVDGIPPHLQPGKIATLQPQNIDRGGDVSALLNDDKWWMQKKIDGYRLVTICTPDEIFYQKRSLKLDTPPTPEIDEALRKIANFFGTIILDGELTWLDVHTKEHRTAAQAATANIMFDQPEAQPVGKYMVFDCLYFEDYDLTPAEFIDRADALDNIDLMVGLESPVLVLDVISESEDKILLGDIQKSQGREGLIFRDSTSTYVAGKSGTAYRHKFLMEHELDVTGLTETTAQGRQFGAIETALGSVGTGFSDADQLEIKQAYENGGLRIEVVSQGLTENGRLWHPRFIKIIQ